MSGAGNCDGVAVRRRLGHDVHAEDAVRARAVIRRDRRAKELA